jgi:hypothetical protein
VQAHPNGMALVFRTGQPFQVQDSIVCFASVNVVDFMLGRWLGTEERGGYEDLNVNRLRAALFP